MIYGSHLTLSPSHVFALIMTKKKKDVETGGNFPNLKAAEVRCPNLVDDHLTGPRGYIPMATYKSVTESAPLKWRMHIHVTRMQKSMLISYKIIQIHLKIHILILYIYIHIICLHSYADSAYIICL